MIKQTTPETPADLDTFLKSKSIGNLSLKTLITIATACTTIAASAFALGALYTQRGASVDVQTRQQSVMTQNSEPTYTYPVEVMFIVKPILLTKAVDLTQCIHSLSDAFRKTGAEVTSTALYVEGVFSSFANFGNKRATFQCHRTSIGGVIASAVIFAPSQEIASSFWGGVTEKLEEWRPV